MQAFTGYHDKGLIRRMNGSLERQPRAIQRGDADLSPSGYIKMAPSGSGSVLNPSGIKTGVPSNSVPHLRPSFLNPKNVPSPSSGTTSAPRVSY